MARSRKVAFFLARRHNATKTINWKQITIEYMENRMYGVLGFQPPCTVLRR